jgi:hypothetical protein
MARVQTRAIGPVGTIARILVGSACLWLAITNGLQWWDVGLGLIVLPLVVTFGHAWIIQQNPSALRTVDIVGACATALIVTPLLIIPFTLDGTLLWVGASMLVAAWYGYAGCEVLAVSNWLLGRNDTVGCLVFSPIDELEARVAGRTIADSAQ